MRNPLTLFMLGAIRLYQLTLSPWVGRECRFLPTCSAYAMEAIERFGPLGGGYLALMRILRCHPFGGRGLDPVPERFTWRPWRHEPQEPSSADGGHRQHISNR